MQSINEFLKKYKSNILALHKTAVVHQLTCHLANNPSKNGGVLVI